MSETLSETLPGGYALSRLSRITARLVPHDWAWARTHADEIAAHWQRRRAARPGLYDGPVFLACGCEVAEGGCAVDLFETSYSAFLAHRDLGFPDGSVANAFAAIVPVGSDGGVLLGEMAPHTANAGQIYFACGTPDRDDLLGDRVDLAGSAARELLEETGLSLPPGAAESWVLLRGEGHLAFLRPVRFPQDARALRGLVERHLAGEDRPELSEIVTVRERAEIDPERMPGYVRAFLEGALRQRPTG